MFLSLYYQVSVDKKETWFFVAALRSFENVSFDRTLDKESGIFEIFVPEDNESIFLEIMKTLQKLNIVFDFKKLPNRLINQEI